MLREQLSQLSTANQQNAVLRDRLSELTSAKDQNSAPQAQLAVLSPVVEHSLVLQAQVSEFTPISDQNSVLQQRIEQLTRELHHSTEQIEALQHTNTVYTHELQQRFEQETALLQRKLEEAEVRLYPPARHSVAFAHACTMLQEQSSELCNARCANAMLQNQIADCERSAHEVRVRDVSAASSCGLSSTPQEQVQAVEAANALAKVAQAEQRRMHDAVVALQSRIQQQEVCYAATPQLGPPVEAGGFSSCSEANTRATRAERYTHCTVGEKIGG
jgi:myosin heavy subunit